MKRPPPAANRGARKTGFLLALLGAACASGCGVDRSGTGFYRVVADGERRELVDPAGKSFYSFGVNSIEWNGIKAPSTGANPYRDAVRARYADESAWATATAARLEAWGWNTVGSWSSYASLGALMPYTVMLELSGANWQTGETPDFFAPEWEARVIDKAAAVATPLRDDPRLVGYFLDNEMHWGLDWRIQKDLFDTYLALDATAPGKEALVELLKERHGGNLASLNTAWKISLGDWAELAPTTTLPGRGVSPEADEDRSAFVSLVARRYFETTARAIRAVDPNHLLLGVRFIASLVPIEVAKAAAEFMDVISVNAYEFIADPVAIFRPELNHFVDLSEPVGGRFLEAWYRATGKPILVSEFGFRAADSGLPNSYPPVYPTLATQTERADRFEAYARRCLAAPFIVGYHWYAWSDQPAEGRFDGENNNWGLVTSGDDPWTELTSRSAAVNRAP